jgi:SsrA-binding protein
MAKKPGKPGENERVIENRRARFDYHIGETLECGICLHGWEVKSVRDGKVSLQEGYVRAGMEPPEMYLYSVNIAEYSPAGGANMKDAPTRTRKLLANKREIAKFYKASQIKGNTIVPLKIYFKNGFAKLLVGLGTGKKAHDKRETIKQRETDRELRRAVSKRVDH